MMHIEVMVIMMYVAVWEARGNQSRDEEIVVASLLPLHLRQRQSRIS
jgi:hypothetical protein